MREKGGIRSSVFTATEYTLLFVLGTPFDEVFVRRNTNAFNVACVVAYIVTDSRTNTTEDMEVLYTSTLVHS